MRFAHASLTDDCPIRKKCLALILMATITSISCAHVHENPFWGDGTEYFEVQEIFFDERFPNVVVSADGTVIATWGRYSYQVRQSDDGGRTWHTSAPFPARGTGEAALEELPDGSQHRDYGLMGGLVRLPLDDHDILLFSNIESDDGRHGGTVNIARFNLAWVTQGRDRQEFLPE